MKWLKVEADLGVEGTDVEVGVKLVLASRCHAHGHVRPLNERASDGAECPICAFHEGQVSLLPDAQAAPGLVTADRYLGRCQACGAVRMGTLAEFEMAQWEIANALGADTTFTCAACVLGLTRAEPAPMVVYRGEGGTDGESPA